MSSTTAPFPVRRIAIVGVGLIGGSLAAAIKAKRLAETVIGVGRNLDRLNKAREAGLIDEVAQLPPHGKPNADLWIFCTPVDQIAAGVILAAGSCDTETVITDAGSVKGVICESLRGKLPPHVHFVGSHPLAGSEKQGFEYARKDLFDQRACIITPDGSSSKEALRRLRAFWEAIGSRVTLMSPEEHDSVLARTSHLPHLVAATLAATLKSEQQSYAATGFRDSTRIAAGDETLWSAIFLQNGEALLQAGDSFEKIWREFRDALKGRNRERIEQLLKEAREIREQLS